MMRSAALILVSILAARDLATAKCAMPSVGSAVITPATAKLPADGGVLVGATASFEVQISGADTALNPTWRFGDGSKELVPVLVTLAPGLVVYRPPAGMTGALTLKDGKAEIAKLTVTADKPAALAAPEPHSLVLNKVAERYGGFRLQIDAKLKTAVPAGAVAIVVLAVTKKGNVPRSWVRVEANATDAQVAGSSGRCDPGVPGEIMSKAGDKVVLAYVDAYGRLSKPSRPVNIKRGK